MCQNPKDLKLSTRILLMCRKRNQSPEMSSDSPKVTQSTGGRVGMKILVSLLPKQHPLDHMLGLYNKQCLMFEDILLSGKSSYLVLHGRRCMLAILRYQTTSNLVTLRHNHLLFLTSSLIGYSTLLFWAGPAHSQQCSPMCLLSEGDWLV